MHRGTRAVGLSCGSPETLPVISAYVRQIAVDTRPPAAGAQLVAPLSPPARLAQPSLRSAPAWPQCLQPPAAPSLQPKVICIV